MDELSAAGLSGTEAKTYKALLTRKEWLPSELSQTVQETRTNIYKILDKLVGLQLAERIETSKKLRYRATNPARLLELAREIRSMHEHAEQSLEASSHELIRQYVATQEQAAVQFYQGQPEIATMFQEIARSKSPIRFMLSNAAIDTYGFSYMHELRMLAVKAGIDRFAITPDVEQAPKNYKDTDPLFKLRRTWLPPEDYTAAVEWGTFGNKMYIISYGSEALGMIIESPQIAEAFQQVYKLIDKSQRARDNYSQLPRNAQAIVTP
jgi:sugar-specific transcriptional regulator TrmB